MAYFLFNIEVTTLFAKPCPDNYSVQVPYYPHKGQSLLISLGALGSFKYYAKKREYVTANRCSIQKREHHVFVDVLHMLILVTLVEPRLTRLILLVLS